MFDKVFIGIDGSKEAANAATIAHELGLLEGSKVDLVSALDLGEFKYSGFLLLTPNIIDEISGAFEESQKRIKDSLEQRGHKDISMRVLDGPAAKILTNVNEVEQGHLVVVGRQGLGRFQRMFLGSVSQRILETSKRPVLIVPSDCTEVPKSETILVPTDFSESCRPGINMALGLAKRLKLKVHFLHCAPKAHLISVAPFPGAINFSDTYKKALVDWNKKCREAMDALVSEAESAGVEATYEIAKESMPHGLATRVHSQDYRFVVMASHGHSGFEAWFVGSNTRATVQESKVPVLVLRAEPQDSAE